MPVASAEDLRVSRRKKFHGETRTDIRYNWPGRLLPRRAPAPEGIRGPRDHPSPHRSTLTESIIYTKVSFEEPEYTTDIVAMGTLRLLDSVRDYRDRTGENVRIYQAGSSEMYGAAAPPQREATLFDPRSPKKQVQGADKSKRTKGWCRSSLRGRMR